MPDSCWRRRPWVRLGLLSVLELVMFIGLTIGLMIGLGDANRGTQSCRTNSTLTTLSTTTTTSSSFSCKDVDDFESLVVSMMLGVEILMILCVSLSSYFCLRACEGEGLKNGAFLRIAWFLWGFSVVPFIFIGSPKLVLNENNLIVVVTFFVGAGIRPCSLICLHILRCKIARAERVERLQRRPRRIPVPIEMPQPSSCPRVIMSDPNSNILPPPPCDVLVDPSHTISPSPPSYEEARQAKEQEDVSKWF